MFIVYVIGFILDNQQKVFSPSLSMRTGGTRPFYTLIVLIRLSATPLVTCKIRSDHAKIPMSTERL